MLDETASAPKAMTMSIVSSFVGPPRLAATSIWIVFVNGAMIEVGKRSTRMALIYLYHSMMVVRFPTVII